MNKLEQKAEELRKLALEEGYSIIFAYTENKIEAEPAVAMEGEYGYLVSLNLTILTALDNAVHKAIEEIEAAKQEEAS